jgi:hypothetical protein
VLGREVVVGAVNHPLEHEADHTAENILASPFPRSVNGTFADRQWGKGNEVRTSGAGPVGVGQCISSSGKQLASDLQEDMESRFGHDFSNVRIHADPDAYEAASALGARAFTVGQNIVLGRDQYAPTTAAGRRLLAHELAHVVQQSSGAGQAFRSPLIQRVLAVAQPPDPFNTFTPVLKEAERENRKHPPQPAPLVPEATVPGDVAQQYRLFRVSGWELLERSDVGSRIDELAGKVEAHGRGGRSGVTRNDLRVAFAESIEYILTIRETTGDVDPITKAQSTVTAQELLLRQLGREEAALVKSFQGSDLVAQVVALRARYMQRWTETVEIAVRRFLVLADNKVADALLDNRPELPFVFGLPAGLEKTVTAQDAPGQLQHGATPVAASVVRFWKAVQKKSGSNVVAENYGDHETHNPHFPAASVGHYSFDIHPDVNKDPDTGFYEHGKIVAFFKAVEDASQEKGMGIEWNAYYNDASVIKEVNSYANKQRVVLSGGGGRGAYHHGPEPYILHVHFNIMPIALAAAYLVGDRLVRARQIFKEFFDGIAAGL